MRLLSCIATQLVFSSFNLVSGSTYCPGATQHPLHLSFPCKLNSLIQTYFKQEMSGIVGTNGVMECVIFFSHCRHLIISDEIGSEWKS